VSLTDTSIKVRLSHAEKRAWERAAKERGWAIADMVRLVINAFVAGKDTPFEE
jgi:hypothetical protein